MSPSSSYASPALVSHLVLCFSLRGGALGVTAASLNYPQGSQVSSVTATSHSAPRVNKIASATLSSALHTAIQNKIPDDAQTTADSRDSWVILGVILGVVVGLVLVCAFLAFWIMRRRKALACAGGALEDGLEEDRRISDKHQLPPSGSISTSNSVQTSEGKVPSEHALDIHQAERLSPTWSPNQLIASQSLKSRFIEMVEPNDTSGSSSIQYSSSLTQSDSLSDAQTSYIETNASSMQGLGLTGYTGLSNLSCAFSDVALSPPRVTVITPNTQDKVNGYDGSLQMAESPEIASGLSSPIELPSDSPSPDELFFNTSTVKWRHIVLYPSEPFRFDIPFTAAINKDAPIRVYLEDEKSGFPSWLLFGATYFYGVSPVEEGGWLLSAYQGDMCVAWFTIKVSCTEPSSE
ncbi:hypothetical protein FRB99_002966 [Tulasnella sp. 403]|nr:hypothetical protein FRB99_002966 [Tulasnella sp. 403]